MINVLYNKHGIPGESIAVLTPYTAQKEYLTRNIPDNLKKAITVASVTESQGKCIIN